MQDCAIILETCNVVEASSIQVLEESKTATGSTKTKFKTVLQTVDEVNKNGRVYPMSVAKSIASKLKPMAENRSLYAEIDHPFTISQNPQDSLRRASMVELKNCGALISKVYLEGNKIMGVLETLSGFKGPDFRDLVMVDKANIGFSLRMLGRIQKHPTMEGVIMPAEPMRPITYDIVTNPSHNSARVVKIVNESELLSDVSDDDEMITESLLLEHANMPMQNEIVESFLADMISASFDNYRPSFRF